MANRHSARGEPFLGHLVEPDLSMGWPLDDRRQWPDTDVERPGPSRLDLDGRADLDASPSDHSVYTANVGPVSDYGVQALLRCNGGYAFGAGTLSERATMWSYSNLDTWAKIPTTAFDAEPKNELRGIDGCGDAMVLVGWAEASGVQVAAAWTYATP